MKNAFTVLAVGQVSSNLAELAVILILSELNSFEEILGVVGFSGFGDILFDGEIEDWNKKVQIWESSALVGVIVPKVFELFVDSPYLS